MKNVFALALTLAVMMSVFPVNAFSAAPVINVYNWGEYIPDGTDGTMDLNAEFTKKTGIKVNYTTYQSNEELYTKIASGGVSYDIVIPSDYMISKMIQNDMLAELDFDNIPNIKNINSEFLNPQYDPDNKYSVPYSWGTVGIIYNKKLIDNIDDVKTWNVFWNQKYSGNILMFSNSRDAFAIAFSKLGYSLNTTDVKEWRTAAAELIRQKPLVQSYAMDQIMDKMIAGEAAVAPYYAGDAYTCMLENPDLDFIIPSDGVANRFVDAMCVLKDSQHKSEAESYINFILEPEVGKEVSEFLGYSTPNVESYKLLDEKIKSNQIIYPSEKVLKNTEIFVNLPPEIDELQKDLWTEVRAQSTGSIWSIVSVIGIFTLIWGVTAFYMRVVKKRKFKFKFKV